MGNATLEPTSGQSTSGRKFSARKRNKRKLTPAQIEEILKHPESLAAWPADWESFQRVRLSRLKHELYGRASFKVSPVGGLRFGKCCSHAWADHCWETAEAYPPKPAPRRRQGAGSPASQQTPASEAEKPAEQPAGMVRCPRCRAEVPPIYLGSSGHCMDCRLESMPESQSHALGKSASVIDYHHLRRR